MKVEEWKDIKGYEGYYQISNLGKVRSLNRNPYQSRNREHPSIILRDSVKSNGYKVVSLFRNGKGKTFHLHRLIALSFIANPKNEKVVNHIDGNRLNNNLNNLEWCSQSYNLKDAYSRGTKKNGKKKKYNSTNAKQLFDMIRQGFKVRIISETLGIPLRTVYAYRKYQLNNPNL